MNKQYLGDAVYCEIKEDMVELTTDTGCGATNTIYLAPMVYEALVRYMTKYLIESQS